MEQTTKITDETAAKDRERSARKRPVRSKTISIKRLSKAKLERGRQMYPEDTKSMRPRTRAECVNGPRPCPYVSCAHHLYLDVSNKTGSIKLNFPDIEVWEMSESCALDVADRGCTTLEEVGAIMNLTRERIRQVDAVASKAFAEEVKKRRLDLYPEEPQQAPYRKATVKFKDFGAVGGYDRTVDIPGVAVDVGWGKKKRNVEGEEQK